MTLQWEIKPRYHPVEVFDDADEAADYITTNEEYIDELEVDVDEYLDEEYGSIDIRGRNFSAAEILYAMDEDRYYEVRGEIQRESAENNTEWIADQLRRMDPGETHRYEGDIVVTCVEVGNEDEEESGFDHEGFESAFE